MTASMSSPQTSSVAIHASSQGYSVGVFSLKGTQLPPACLRHCLNGDAKAASTHGCAMVKHLVGCHQSDTNSALADRDPTNAPSVCGQGYAVSLWESNHEGAPDILLLGPPTQAGDSSQVTCSALETIRLTAAENWHLQQEIEGLADEVLRSYEQINFVFDVSAQLAVVSSSDEVRQTLLTKLRHMFGADAVFLVSADCRNVLKVDQEGQFTRGWPREILSASADIPSGCPDNMPKPTPRDTIDLPPEYHQVTRQLQQSQSVFVFARDSNDIEAGHGTSMWGPLRGAPGEGEKVFSIIGIVRCNKQFASGDMLLFDSALTFSSHILSNLSLVEQVRQTSIETVRALVNALDQKDNYTCGHSERVGFLARITGQFMGLPVQQVQELEWAGLLHDVGKIGIPEMLLNKPGKLTRDEFADIQGHPLRGHNVLQPVASLQPVLAGVLHHHENPDGTGYPDGLKGDEIPLIARIIHVVDVFDALTSTRSYRTAYDTQCTIEILKEDAGTKLDAQIVEHFLKVWELLPTTHPEQYQKWFGYKEEMHI